MSTTRAVTLRVPADVSQDDARLAAAIGLFVGARVSLGKAAELAGLSRRALMAILAHREIPVVKCAASELDDDLGQA